MYIICIYIISPVACICIYIYISLYFSISFMVNLSSLRFLRPPLGGRLRSWTSGLAKRGRPLDRVDFTMVTVGISPSNIHGFIWFYMVLYGFIWFYDGFMMVLYGFIWIYMVLWYIIHGFLSITHHDAIMVNKLYTIRWKFDGLTSFENHRVTLQQD